MKSYEFFRHNKIPKNNTIEFSDDIEFVVSNLIECVILLDKVPEFLEVIVNEQVFSLHACLSIVSSRCET